ncbi:MAG: DUF86 domain-containing protein [Planctomycetia bacterium]|nr:DUF86 domain-containing protein [Planctomycetia bacterium]
MPYSVDSIRLTTGQLCAKIEKQDAIIRRIEIIGEATVHLTEETRIAIPELPFRKMRGMRNIVTHDSANVLSPSFAMWPQAILRN